MKYFEYFAKLDRRLRMSAMVGETIIRLSKGGTYCTMFAFEGVDDPNLLHCTHKYFGEGTASKDAIIRELESYFSKTPFKPFQAAFDRLEHFGENKDYRVVTPESNEAFLPDLKARLDRLEPDKFPEYRPHVTVGRNTDRIDSPIRDYVLMENHKPIWSAAGAQKAIRKETADFFHKARSK